MFGVWRDGHRFVGATSDRPEAVALICECGLSEGEAEQLMELALPEGWASVSAGEAGQVTLVLTSLSLPT